MTNYQFHWYRMNDDGTADVFDDEPALWPLINEGIGSWWSTPEGCIRYAGLQASAFTQKTEMTYDASLWLKTNGRVRREMGMVTTTVITATPDERNPQ